MNVLTKKSLPSFRKLWRDALTQTLYVVTHGREYLVEGPLERQDRQQRSIDDEAVLRVFTEFEDAWLYCESQRENYLADENEMRVAHTNLEHLFGLIPLIRQNAHVEWDTDVTIDLCRVIEGEPVSIDVLNSTLVTLN